MHLFDWECEEVVSRFLAFVSELMGKSTMDVLDMPAECNPQWTAHSGTLLHDSLNALHMTMAY